VKKIFFLRAAIAALEGGREKIPIKPMFSNKHRLNPRFFVNSLYVCYVIDYINYLVDYTPIACVEYPPLTTLF
jgi:hypothetical protein